MNALDAAQQKQALLDSRVRVLLCSDPAKTAQSFSLKASEVQH